MKSKILKTILFDQRVTQLILYVTNRCNLKCNTCFVDFDNYNGKELELNEIKDLAGYFKDILWLNISGGEPFLRQDLPDICATFNTKIISIPTNGYNPKLIHNLTKEIRDRVNCELNIAVSIDGFEKTNDIIRSRGSFTKAIETLELLKKIDNVKIKVNTVLCEQNYDELIEFMQFIYGHNVDFHSLIFLRGKPNNPDYRLPSYEKLENIKKDVFRIWSKYSYAMNPLVRNMLKKYHRLLYNTSLRVLKEQKQIPSCLAHKYHLVISPEGEVSFCELLKPIGNLREKPIEEILNSLEAKKMREQIKDKKCYCHHNCNFLDNILLNPVHYPKLLFGIGTK